MAQTQKLNVVRALDDDYYEVQGPRGRSQFMQLFSCGSCSKLTPRRILCQFCNKTKQDEALRSKMAIVAHQRRQAMLADSKKRRYAMQMQASPDWRDQAKIRAIYAEAERKTKETGVAHHVDHIYPIQGVISCGLHVHHNLRVIAGLENCAKGNGHPMHESPALVAFIAEYGQAGFAKWLAWFKKEMKLLK